MGRGAARSESLPPSSTGRIEGGCLGLGVGPRSRVRRPARSRPGTGRREDGGAGRTGGEPSSPPAGAVEIRAVALPRRLLHAVGPSPCVSRCRCRRCAHADLGFGVSGPDAAHPVGTWNSGGRREAGRRSGGGRICGSDCGSARCRDRARGDCSEEGGGMGEAPAEEEAPAARPAGRGGGGGGVPSRRRRRRRKRAFFFLSRVWWASFRTEADGGWGDSELEPRGRRGGRGRFNALKQTIPIRWMEL